MLEKLRYRIAGIIKPKKKYKTRVGKLGAMTMTEGSDKLTLNLLNNSLNVSVNLRTLLKSFK